MLIKAGCDMDKAENSFGATPMYAATKEGHSEVVEALIKGGCDVNNAETDYGATPLMLRTAGAQS